MKKNYLRFLIFLSFALLFNACESDSDELFEKLEVELVSNNKINYQGDEFFLRIVTSGDWKIEKPVSDSWYSFSITSGQGSQTIVLKVSENDDGQRIGKFTVAVGTEKKTIEIVQDAFDEDELYYDDKEAYRIEIPRLSEDVAENKAAFVAHYTGDNDGVRTLNFSLEYNYGARHSRWVAFTFYDKTSKSNTSRTNAWQADPKLSKWTNNFSDYRGSGYDRGHIVASADRLFSQSANEQTFYFSNISPQVNSFNAGIWLELEDAVRKWGKNGNLRDTLYVVKGGTIRDDQVLRTIGDNKVSVPKHYYMALLSKKGATYKSIAFWFENRSYPKPYKLAHHALSVEELEEKTGIDFFHNLPDDIERVVEKQKRTSDWPGL